MFYIWVLSTHDNEVKDPSISLFFDLAAAVDYWKKEWSEWRWVTDPYGPMYLGPYDQVLEQKRVNVLGDTSERVRFLETKLHIAFELLKRQISVDSNAENSQDAIDRDITEFFRSMGIGRQDA